MNIVSTCNAPSAIGPYSQAVSVGNLLFTSGQIALRPDGSFVEGDVSAQIHQVLQNLQAVLEAGGSCVSKVVKTTIFLSTMDDFQVINAIYGDFFGEHKPARSTIAVKGLPRNALIEIEAIALIEPK